MTKRDYRRALAGSASVRAEVRRVRAVGDYDKSARESQRRASAYGRARGNQ